MRLDIEENFKDCTQRLVIWKHLEEESEQQGVTRLGQVTQGLGAWKGFGAYSDCYGKQLEQRRHEKFTQEMEVSGCLRY